MDPEPGMTSTTPCCGSAGLLIKCELALEEKMNLRSRKNLRPAQALRPGIHAETWAMANMNMIIHDMEGQIEIGDTFKNPKFRKGNRLQTFDRVVANPMWNQDWFTEKDYDADELDRFPKGAGFPGSKADWGWVQHILASLNDAGRAAIVLDTGAASRGSGNANTNKEKDVRQWFVEQDLIEGVIYLPENLFYNTTAPGIILFLNKAKPKERKGKLFLVNASQRVRQGRPEELHPRRRHPPHRRHLQGLARRGEIQPHRRPRGDRQERLQHLPQPLHPHRRRRGIPADRGDCGGVGRIRIRGFRNQQDTARNARQDGTMIAELNGGLKIDLFYREGALAIPDRLSVWKLERCRAEAYSNSGRLTSLTWGRSTWGPPSLLKPTVMLTLIGCRTGT